MKGKAPGLALARATRATRVIHGSLGGALHRRPVRVYHGTALKLAHKIVEEGLRAGSYVTTTEAVAEQYAVRTSALYPRFDGDQATTEWAVIALDVPERLLIEDLADTQLFEWPEDRPPPGVIACPNGCPCQYAIAEGVQADACIKMRTGTAVGSAEDVRSMQALIAQARRVTPLVLERLRDDPNGFRAAVYEAARVERARVDSMKPDTGPTCALPGDGRTVLPTNQVGGATATNGPPPVAPGD